MRRQTPMNSPEVNSNGSPAKAVFGSAAGVVHDITELAELQVKLFAADASSFRQRLKLPSILLVFAGCMLLGLLPVALLGLAELFLEYFELTRAAALFAAAGCGAIITLLAAGTAWLRLRNSFSELDASRAELQRNLDWVKATLKGGGIKHPQFHNSKGS